MAWAIRKVSRHSVGVTGHGTERLGAAGRGEDWRGEERLCQDRRGKARLGAALSGRAVPGAARRGTERHSKARHPLLTENKSPMTHPSKTKGNAYERELVNLAKESGLEAKRAYASNGESLGIHAEVDLVIEDKRIQAKRRKSIASFLQPSEHYDAVAVRQDRGESLIVISIYEYLDLLKARKNASDDTRLS